MALNFIPLTVKSASELSKMTEEELISYKTQLEETQKKNWEVAQEINKESEAKATELETALKAQALVIETLKEKGNNTLASIVAKKQETLKKAISEIKAKES